MIILFTSENIASLNIAGKLIERHGFAEQAKDEWIAGGVRLIDTHAPSVLEVPTGFQTDCLLVLSTHKSRTHEKVMTAHMPGNWGDAGMGGSPRTLNMAPASRLKTLFREIKKQADRIGWGASLEADHHGPTCGVPIMFAEIGSSEEEWGDDTAAAAMADAVAAALPKHETFETVFGVGGGHCPRELTKLVLESELAVGHIAPKYAIDLLDDEMFSQAIERNVEKVSRVLVVKDQANLAQKEKIRKLAEGHGIALELI
ncbi:MAG: D-aminoacyl-tRNA deacylase [Candidatus Micrarchaeota archaeon]